MNEEMLIRAVFDRASNPATRTDYMDRRPAEIGTPATQTVIEASESAMGRSLYPLHRRLFEEVGNGGFGPGDGLIGLPGGSLDVDGRSIVELKRVLRLDYNTPLPAPVVPLCDWGGGIWSCIDCDTGVVLTLSEFGCKEIARSLHSWLEDWVSGIDLWQQMVVLKNETIIGPFTRQERTMQVVAGIAGKQYIPRR
jgi:hypothetical protein